MELPKTGSIVILDDKINEAMPIMNILSSQGVSYCYFDGKPANYPSEPLNNIRMIFLDMHLDEIASASNSSKNIVSALMSGLDLIVSKENGPYAILVWSKHDSQHMKEFVSTVMGEKGLINKPIAILNMEKSECLERRFVQSGGEEKQINQQDESEWKLKSNGASVIKEKMQNQLKFVDAFEILYVWENGIRESAKDTVQTMSMMFGNESNEWNNNIKSYFYKMAKAYAGKTLVNNSSDIIRNVYYSMNDIVNDRNCVIMEQKANNISDVEICQFDQEVEGRIEICKMVASKNYVLRTDDKIWYLYRDGELIYKNKILQKVFDHKFDDSDIVVKEIEKMYWYNISKLNSLLLMRNYVLNECRPGNIYVAHENIKNELCSELGLTISQRVSTIGIELEISPICDYSQNKRKRLRILPGLLVPNEIAISDKAKYMYVSKPILFDDKIKRMIFDFRYYTSENEKFLLGKQAKCAISDQMLQNVKEELSAHGTRSGLVFVE